MAEEPTEAIATMLPPPPAGATGAGTVPTPAPYEETRSFSVVEQTTPLDYDAGAFWDAGATGAWPVEVTSEGAVVAPPPSFRVTPLLVVASLAAVIAGIAAFVEVVSYRIVGDLDQSLSVKANDFSTNNVVACLIAAVVLVGGAALGATGRRIGSGLAGGAGLALAGLMGWIAAQGVTVLDTVKQGLIAKGGTYTLTTTMSAGFWLVVVAGALGAIVFFASLAEAGNDGARPINAAVGALGALGTVAVVVGTLLPMKSASFSDNFSSDLGVPPLQFWKLVTHATLGIDHQPVPPIATYLRLVVLFVIAVGGVVGFLSSRRWGIGLALGTVSIQFWFWLTAQGAWGDRPWGIAGGNPTGVVDWSAPLDFTPHVLTTVGVIVMLVAGLGGVMLDAQRRHADQHGG